MIVTDVDILVSLLPKVYSRPGKWPRGVVLTSGYYDPIHFGHVQYLTSAAKLGTIHVAVVNGDTALMLKRDGRAPFMPAEERLVVVDGIKGVTFTLLWDQPTIVGVIEKLRPSVFAKGGDRTGAANIPEWQACHDSGTDIITCVGGEKEQSSSWLLAKANR